MTPEQIRARRGELSSQIQNLKNQIEHVRIDFKHLQLECKHPGKISTNTWGRDPGGAHCPDCDKNW
jgi:hypothetical protein